MREWTNADCGRIAVNTAIQREVCILAGGDEIFEILKLKQVGKMDQLPQVLFPFSPQTTFSYQFYYLDALFPNRCWVSFWTHKYEISQHHKSTWAESTGVLPKNNVHAKTGHVLKETVIQQKHSHTKRKPDNLGNLFVTCFRASDDSIVAMLLSWNEAVPYTLMRLKNVVRSSC